MPSTSGFGRLFGRLVGTSALAGLVLAAVLLPVVGGTGLAARTAVSTFRSLPKQLPNFQLPQRSRLYAANGSLLATFYQQNRIDVPLSKVAPVMQTSIVAIEDSSFWHEPAVDIRGILRAGVIDFLHHAPVQGASTITQQYVKNLLVESAQNKAGQQAAIVDSIGRKIREARYAIALGEKLTKKQILNRYLNIVYFGDGAYGVEAAARHFFGVHASQLTLPQAALLGGLVQDPTAYNPRLHPTNALTRRNIVLARMTQLHDITPAQAAAAAATPLGLHVAQPQEGCGVSSAPFFCTWVVGQLAHDPALGHTVKQRVAALYSGGLTIRTTLDPAVQAAAQQALAQELLPTDSVAGAVAVVQPGTGNVLAMAQSRAYGTNTKKRQTTINLVTGGLSGYQAGSTFKIFTLTAALEQHIPLSYTINAPPKFTLTGVPNCTTGAIFPPYPVGNAGAGEGGTFNLLQATWDSINTYYVQLEKKTGLCAPAQIAQQEGVTQVGGHPLARVPSFTLGSNAVGPLEMAGAYATYAARGLYCPPTGVVSMTRGGVTHRVHAACKQIVPQKVADEVTSVLRGVIDGPDPGRTGGNASIGRPAAGKTGTTDGFSAAWFDGYTPQLATAVWVGSPAGGYGHPLTNVTIGGRFYAHVYGGDVGALIWRDTMSAALANSPVQDFTNAPMITSVPGAPTPPPSPAPVAPAPTTAAPTSASPSPKPKPKPSPTPTKPKPSPTKPGKTPAG